MNRNTPRRLLQRHSLRHAIFLACLSLLNFVGVSRADELALQLTSRNAAQLAAQAMEHDDAERGRAIIHREKLGCVKCHTAAKDHPDQRPIGPPLAMLGERKRRTLHHRQSRRLGGVVQGYENANPMVDRDANETRSRNQYGIGLRNALQKRNDHT